MIARGVLILSGLFAGTACSSVPDIRFEESDAQAAADAPVVARDAGADAAPAPVACPGSPPAGGVCCGSVVCAGCTGASCADCLALGGCPTGSVCCVRGSNVKCVEASGCR